MVYSGPVRPGTDEAYFRKTGKSRKKKKEEEDKKKIKEIEEPVLPKKEPIKKPPQVTAGLTPADQLELATSRAKQAGEIGAPVLTPAGDIVPSAEQRAVREQLGQAQKGGAFLEEAGFAEEKIPEKVELGMEREGILETAPIFGPGSKAWEIAMKELLNVDVDKLPLLQNPETAREFVLQEIQRKEIEVGTSGSENFGALVESLPLIGPKLGKYVGELLETPSANVDSVVTNIKDSRGRVLKSYEAVRAGLVDPYVAYQSILDEEEEMFRLEQRIKNLANESAELIADADKLNLIENKILRAKQVIFFAKQAAAIAVKGEPTNAAVETWLMNELEDLE